MLSRDPSHFNPYKKDTEKTNILVSGVWCLNKQILHLILSFTFNVGLLFWVQNKVKVRPCDGAECEGCSKCRSSAPKP